MQKPSALLPADYQRPWRRALSALGTAISDEPGPSFLSGVMVVSTGAAVSLPYLAPKAMAQFSPFAQPTLVVLSLLLAGCYAVPVIGETRKNYLAASRLQVPIL